MQYNILTGSYVSINDAISYSTTILNSLKQDLVKALAEIEDLEFTIITTGSFGRLEASAESDIDLFIFCDKDATLEQLIAKKDCISECVKKYIKKDVGDTGTFGPDATEVFEVILANIGGNNDTNATLTRRMLFLLEGKAIYNEVVFNKYKKTLINKYLKSSSEGKIDKYLLNDIIRYYRTITTDFQHKVDAGGKSWGIRNIKLRFSRKLLYFAGVLAIAYVADNESDKDKRVDLLSNIFAVPALERIFTISNETISIDESDKILNDVFESYEVFLSCISNKYKRAELEAITDKEERLNNVTYTEISMESIKFSDKLYKLLKLAFPDEHPIHSSLIF
ncbi:nucleotidyltransferase domain-containing protein [Pantoea stewartii]|uniref:nucleotidyltransferase domain-containing protein n=1 Tax=Pantoea stewartii TaxID=66269 RepID=UPI0023FA0235|nr:nucleotidyltransferase domain-containing protein [Pantoea stewartii]MDF7788579.1 nucleotidyltransferase domain-containing protein [Pantoea stewartii]